MKNGDTGDEGEVNQAGERGRKRRRINYRIIEMEERSGWGNAESIVSAFGKRPH